MLQSAKAVTTMPSRSELYSRWSLEMRRKGLFRAGQRVGVAVSGGPDSVLLLQWMRRFAREHGLTLSVVHFNHQLRGAESDADEVFVRGLAQSLELDYHCSQADVARVARERKCNLEAVARELRYRFFFSLVDAGRLDCVATAHTANDQAETVLLRLLRGAGTRGLGGIYPVLDGKIIRPFLGLTRTEVIQEISTRQLSYRVDSSNLDRHFQRNKVRLELLPLLERDFNPEIIPLLKRLADRARDDEAYLERQARDRAHPWRVREGLEERIPIQALREFPAALARRVLRQMVQSVRNSLGSLSHAHLEALLRFATTAQSGKILTLPRGTLARREFSWLVISPPRAATPEVGFSYPVSIPGQVRVAELGSCFHFKIIKRDDIPKAYNLSEMTVGLGPRKLDGELVLRNWRAGDRYRPVGSQGVRKLKDLFRERKIAGGRRRFWPVLALGEQVVWARGFPPATPLGASPECSEVLIVREEPLPPP